VRRARARCGAACALSAGLACAAAAHATPPFAVGGDPRVDPVDFEITTFASGLAYPTSLALLADGSLLVLTNVPDPGGSLFVSSGVLRRLVDADDDGMADDPGSVVYAGLPGTATSVRRFDDLVVVSSRETDSEKISFLRTGAAPGDPLALLGSVDFDFPYPFGGHRNVALALRATPGQPGKLDVVFNAGSQFNDQATTGVFTASGLLAGVPGANAMVADTLYAVTVDPSGPLPVLSDLVVIAEGVRNGAGLAFQPGTGDLWFQDNGPELVTGGPEPKSPDELNRLIQAALPPPAEDFGFPGDYVEYRTGTVVGGAAVQPEFAFQPIPDPYTGDESVGAVEIAFAPPGFPPGLDAGVFVGFHGNFNTAGLANTDNPVVYCDLDTGEWFHFVSTDEPALGHPNGLLAAGDSLWLADLDGDGNVMDAASSGAIYRIRAIGHAVPALPSAWHQALLALVLAAVAAAALSGRARSPAGSGRFRRA
jgi:glucose/arabinose dehydrogenase